METFFFSIHFLSDDSSLYQADTKPSLHTRSELPLSLQHIRDPFHSSGASWHSLLEWQRMAAMD